MKPQDEGSTALSPLPDPAPTSSLADVINRNTEVMQNLCIVLTMLMEMLDPDGLQGDDDEVKGESQYLSPHRPGRG